MVPHYSPLNYKLPHDNNIIIITTQSQQIQHKEEKEKEEEEDDGTTAGLQFLNSPWINSNSSSSSRSCLSMMQLISKTGNIIFTPEVT